MMLRGGSGLARAARAGIRAHAVAGPAVVVPALQPRRSLKAPPMAAHPGFSMDDPAGVQAWLFEVRSIENASGAAAAADTEDTEEAEAVEDGGDDAEEIVEPVVIRRDDYEFSRAGITVLPSELFAVPPRVDLLHRVVVWQRREWWQGTSNAKKRGEVRGGGKKPWPQKGSGRARASSIRSPIWKGGGVVHGPRPRDHSIDIPSKMQKLALRVALSVKYAQGDLYVVDSLATPSPKTQLAAAALEEHSWDAKTLFVGTGDNRNFALSVRNLGTVDYIDEADLNVYQALLRHSLVLTTSAIEALEARLVPRVSPPVSVNDPSRETRFVKPKYTKKTLSKQAQRPDFLPKQNRKKPPKRVVRVYPSPTVRGGKRKYIDRKYAAVGGAAANYMAAISAPVEDVGEEWENED
eukprot:m.442294 g.442294  ORF g.442294 m.442294 type:complete len:408 (+) comp18783_c0_seq1:44-1267(+)